jgi:hypothetical protein
VKKIAGVMTDRSSRPETAENASSRSAIVAIPQEPSSSPPRRAGLALAIACADQRLTVHERS